MNAPTRTPASTEHPPSSDSLANATLFTMMLASGMLLNGLLVAETWVWFVLPVFPSAPSLTVGHAIGLSFFARCLLPQGTRDAKKENEPWVIYIRRSFGSMIAFYLIGFGLALLLHAVLP